jgi:hypothetical protein
MGQLPFVNQHAGVCPAGEHVVLDLVERHHHMFDRWLIEARGQKCGRELARDGDGPAGERAAGIRGRGRTRDDARTVPVTDTGPVREQRVPIREVRIGVQRHRGDFELPAQRTLVQAFDVRQLVLVTPGARIDFPGGERPEHERVVGIRAVCDVDRAGHSGQKAPPHWSVRPRCIPTREAA